MSPGHVGYDRVVKQRIYAEHGVPWLWLVDLDERTLEVFELAEGRWRLQAGCDHRAVQTLPPFDLEIDVGSLFIPRDEPPLAHEPTPPPCGAP